MKLNNRICRIIETKMRNEGLVTGEDDIILGITYDIELNRNNLMNGFDLLIEEINKTLAKSVVFEDDFEELFEDYIDLKLMVEEYVDDNWLITNILNDYKSKITVYKYNLAEIINKYCRLFKNRQERDFYFKVFLEKFNSKLKIIFKEIDTFNNKLAEKNDEIFELMTVVFKMHAQLRLEEEDILTENMLDINTEDLEKIKTNKILNFEGLVQFAQKYGYMYKSKNGSHVKFENIKTRKCVPIPNHSCGKIGKGLSYNIQKQIIEGSK